MIKINSFLHPYPKYVTGPKLRIRKHWLVAGIEMAAESMIFLALIAGILMFFASLY